MALRRMSPQTAFLLDTSMVRVIKTLETDKIALFHGW